MPPGCLPLEVFWGTSNWEETPGQTQNPLEGLSHLAWERLGIPQKELECCWGEGAWGPCLARCHHDPAPDKRVTMDGWMYTGCILLVCDNMLRPICHKNLMCRYSTVLALFYTQDVRDLLDDCKTNHPDGGGGGDVEIIK